MDRRRFLKSFVAAAVGMAAAPALAKVAPGIGRPPAEIWVYRISTSPLFSYGFTGFKPHGTPGGQVLAAINYEVVNGRISDLLK
jgi:hypothetical protein